MTHHPLLSLPRPIAITRTIYVSQEGERNYHIFYQLIAAGEANQKLQSDLKLQDADLFQYTNQGVTIIDGVSDDKDFEDIQVGAGLHTHSLIPVCSNCMAR